MLRGADLAAAAAGNRPLELQARHALGLFELDLGNLPRPAPPWTRRPSWPSGVAWPGAGTGSTAAALRHRPLPPWPAGTRPAPRSAVDERRPAVSAAALYVEIGRGRAAAVERLAWVSSRTEADPYVAYLAGAARPTWSAGRATRNAPASWPARPSRTQEEAGAPWVLSAIWPAALALAAEGDLAERARPPGDQAAQKEHLAVGADVMERARAALQRARTGAPGRPGGAGLAGQGRGRGSGSRAATTPRAGWPRPTPSATATCTRRPGAAGAWPRRGC